MKTKPLQDKVLKSFSPSSSSVSYTGNADGTTEVTLPLYFFGDKTNLRVKTGLDNFVVQYFVKSTGAHLQRCGEANTKLSKPGETHEQNLFYYYFFVRVCKNTQLSLWRTHFPLCLMT